MSLTFIMHPMRHNRPSAWTILLRFCQMSYWTGCTLRRPCPSRNPPPLQASVEREWVGLRPGRSRVRLEAQDLATGGHRRLRVVHNYGHGGGGITLHWGCAGHAVRLVQHSLRHLQERPRL